MKHIFSKLKKKDQSMVMHVVLGLILFGVLLLLVLHLSDSLKKTGPVSGDEEQQFTNVIHEEFVVDVAESEFVLGILDKFQDSFIKATSTDYYMEFGVDPVKGVSVFPCDFTEDNLVEEPECYTRLVFWKLDQEFTSFKDIEANVPFFGEYEERTGVPLEKGKREGTKGYLVTPQKESCIGVGGGACTRTLYAFLLDGGSAIFAELDTWHYLGSGVIGEEPNKKVQSYEALFERALLRE